jgi:predicted transcriptional regulator
VSSDTPVEEAVRLMRDRAIRRLPVVDDDRPVGVISLGDLAMEQDPSSALADISEAPPNS